MAVLQPFTFVRLFLLGSTLAPWFDSCVVIFCSSTFHRCSALVLDNVSRRTRLAHRHVGPVGDTTNIGRRDGVHNRDIAQGGLLLHQGGGARETEEQTQKEEVVDFLA